MLTNKFYGSTAVLCLILALLTNKFYGSTAVLCLNKALWLFKIHHVTTNIQLVDIN